jgi:acetyltransferase-like isoleucine patch superfamily enzyme
VVLRHPHKLEIGANVTIDDYAFINCRGSGENGLVLEDNVIVNRNCVLNAKSGPIRIGKRTRIGSNSFILSIDGVNIGEEVLTGAGCYINGGSYDSENTNVALTDQSVISQGPIEIGKGAWLGTGAIVLDGVKIGQGAIIGAGAVVMKNIPDYTIATGRPPVMIGNRHNLKSS